MEQTNEEGRTLRVAAIVGAFMLVALLCISIGRCSYLAADASRNDVATSVAALSPACRPLAQLRIRDQLIVGGHPISRRRLDSLTTNLDHCDVIDAQMAGVADGMATQ